MLNIIEIILYYCRNEYIRTNRIWYYYE